MKLSIRDLVPVINEAFSMNKNFILPLKGISMLPFFKTGDRAVIDKPQGIHKRDCILFWRGEACVFHRVLKIEDTGFIVAGDNETHFETVAKEAVIAKMTAYYKGQKKKSIHSFLYRFSSFIWSIMLFRKVCRKLFGLAKRK